MLNRIQGTIFVQLSIYFLKLSHKKKNFKFCFVENIYTLAFIIKLMTSVNYIFYSFYYFFFRKEIEALCM